MLPVFELLDARGALQKESDHVRVQVTRQALGELGGIQMREVDANIDEKPRARGVVVSECDAVLCEARRELVASASACFE